MAGAVIQALAVGLHYICGLDTVEERCETQTPQGQTQFESAEARGAAGLQVQGPGFDSRQPQC